MSEIRIKTLVVGMVGTNCYLVYDHETKRAAVIDPGDGAGQIANMAVSLGLKPEAILLTHGHFDHHGGKGTEGNLECTDLRMRKGDRCPDGWPKESRGRLFQRAVYDHTGCHREGG